MGKDTVGDHLVEKYGFCKLSFAEPLKEAATMIFGFSHAQLNSQAGKAAIDPFWGFSPRVALQKLGTEAVRNVFGRDTWVRAAERRLQQRQREHERRSVGNESEPRIVFTDVRFHEEAKMIQRLGGQVWRIDRLGITDKVVRGHLEMLDADGGLVPLPTWFDSRDNLPLHESESALIGWTGWNQLLQGSLENDGGAALRAQADVLLEASGIGMVRLPSHCEHGVLRGTGCHACAGPHP